MIYNRLKKAFALALLVVVTMLSFAGCATPKTEQEVQLMGSGSSSWIEGYVNITMDETVSNVKLTFRIVNQRGKEVARYVRDTGKLEGRKEPYQISIRGSLPNYQQQDGDKIRMRVEIDGQFDFFVALLLGILAAAAIAGFVVVTVIASKREPATETEQE